MSTVIKGATNAADLVRAFIDEASDRIEHGYPNPAKLGATKADDPRCVARAGEIHEELGGIERRFYRVPDYEASTYVDFDLVALRGLLSELAPPGHDFGVNPDDATDFGFWPSEGG